VRVLTATSNRDHNAFTGRTEGGIGVYTHTTDRFKTISLHAVWVTPLRASTAGVTALVPSLLRRGARRWPDWRSMEIRLEELYGAAFRAAVEKVGDQQLLSCHLEIPDGRFLPGKPDTLQSGIEFLNHVMSEPHLVDGRFPAAVVDQEKQTLTRRIHALINDKGQYAALRLMQVMAEGRPFGLPRLGTAEEMALVTAEAATARYRELAAEAPLLFFGVGAVDGSDLDRAVRETWAPRPEVSRLPEIERATPLHHGALVVDEEDVQQGKLFLGLTAGPRLPDPDYPSLMMYTGVLGGFEHSKLFVNVREKASLAYSAYARADGALGIMQIGAGIEFKDFEAATRIILDQVDDMAAGRISDQEMEFTRRRFVNSLKTTEDSPGALIGMELQRHLMGGGLLPAELMPALMAVTVSDITRVAETVKLDSVYFLTAKGEGHDVRLPLP
jgi:predicted Zn-dependent peptidase